jgi:hypothetical protein
MKNQKVKQADIQNYLNLIENTQPPAMAMARLLFEQGCSDSEVFRYLISNGVHEAKAYQILRELNKE